MSNLTSLSNEALNIVVDVLSTAVERTYSFGGGPLWDMYDAASAEMEVRSSVAEYMDQSLASD